MKKGGGTGPVKPWQPVEQIRCQILFPIREKDKFWLVPFFPNE